MNDYNSLPDDLPVPTDDGAAAHLPGTVMPDLALPTTDGNEANMTDLGPGRTIIYLYPMTGKPGVELPDGWDLIPGARGCTPESCGFRDHYQQLREAGASSVYGMSSQTTDYQAEAVERLHLPFPMISDPELSLADALNLPTFSAPGHDRLYSRLTLAIQGNEIEKVFYPIFPPNEHAKEVLDWLHSSRSVERRDSESI